MKPIDFIQPDVEQWLDQFQFTTPLRVRFSETDAFGHVNNVSYMTYFEQGRLDYFDHLGLFQQFLQEDYPTFVVVADIHCHYLKQIYFHQALLLKVRTAKIGRTSLDLQYAIQDEKSSDLLAVARGMIVHVNKRTGKSVPWSPEMRAIVETFEKNGRTF